MKVLIIGGSGAMGGYISRNLIGAGYAVASYGRNSPLVEGAEFVQGDVMDLGRLRSACRGCDAIVHLAVVGLGRVEPEQVMSLNVMGTVHVLEVALREGVGKVAVSSNAVLIHLSKTPDGTSAFSDR
jgi:UDP-glucose 4-epimerase